ncbi:hypothetical protein [Lysinibacillus sp. FSL W8-0992]|uniref:hypothetical protein n=1 Tax=Lysinibacillus sp. FSL W8-0992 TaxID=2954643 RepID=UPI0030F60CA3
MLEKGNKVVMHSCIEAKHYEGIVWTCSTGEQDLCGSPVVWLEDYCGAFAAKYLRKISENENTVPCVDCNKQILHDSNGYYFYALSGKYCCNECYKKSLLRQKVQDEIEQMQITHTVFKNEDVDRLPLKERREFAYLEARITDIRTLEGKKPFPKYIVINTDEDPQMIEEIIKVMKRFRKWG